MMFRNGKITYVTIKRGDGITCGVGVVMKITTKRDYSKDCESIEVRMGLEKMDSLLYFTNSERFEEISGNYVRIAIDENGKIQAIGHLIEDMYFAVDDLYRENKGKKDWNQHEIEEWAEGRKNT